MATSTDPIPDVVDLTFSASLFDAGADVDVQLTGPDIDRLRAAADDLKLRLEEYAAFDIREKNILKNTIEQLKMILKRLFH